MARERYTRYPRPILWLIPEGDFLSSDGSRWAIDPFYISKFPVTNEQFEAFDPGYLRSELSPGDRDPAVEVSLVEAEEYCAWYSEVSRKNMRLPSEQEWEFACRGGSQGRFFSGEDAREADDYLWDADNSHGKLRQADEKRANPFGLFGMLGGVWEWVAEDGGKENEASATAEPEIQRPEIPKAGGRMGVLRGGSFLTPRSEISCSLRRVARDSEILDDAGFRIVKSLR